MIAVIDGRRYNTDTAEEVGRESNGHFRSDFNFETTALYRTPNGRWFQHGEGGATSYYAQRDGNSWCWGEKITAVDDATAQAFLEDLAARGDDAAVIALEKYFTVMEA